MTLTTATATSAKTQAEQLTQSFLENRHNADDCAERLAPLEAELERQILELRQRFAESNAELIAAKTAFNESAEIYEAELRKLALEHFETTGEKTLDEHLGVQVRTKFVYSEIDAIAWAQTNAPVLIRQAIDKKGFEKFADGLAFVTSEHSVTATIRGLK